MPRHEREPNYSHDLEPGVFENVPRFSLAHRIDNSSPPFPKRPQVTLQTEAQNPMYEECDYAEERIPVHMVIDNQCATGFY